MRRVFPWAVFGALFSIYGGLVEHWGTWTVVTLIACGLTAMWTAPEDSDAR